MKKDSVYLVVYLLVKLALILSAATISVERAFSIMKIIKTPLHNRMRDDCMNDCLVAWCHTLKGTFKTVNNEAILQMFS